MERYIADVSTRDKARIMVRKHEAAERKVCWSLPEEIKTWIEEKAAEDERSQNTVVVRILRARMDADKAGATG
jgi:hypothetical protein